MYTLKDDRIVYDAEGATPELVAIAVHNGMEGAARLVARANLADRDESLLDQIGDTITRRNET